MMRKYKIQVLPGADRIRDDIRILPHPHLHRLFPGLERLPGQGVPVDLLVGHDGAVGAVGRGWFGVDVWKEGATDDTVESVCADAEIEAVLVILMRCHRHLSLTLPVKTYNPRIKKYLRPQPLSHRRQSLM